MLDAPARNSCRGRRENVTLPNGIVQTIGYDSASRPTSIVFTNGEDELGDLGYTYNPSGSVKESSGSFARIDLPAAVGSASYNAANRLTDWGNDSLTYDANGSLTSDGTFTYEYDARNKLVGIDEGQGEVAQFAYDPLGRRTEAVDSSGTTAYLYDGVNPVRELDDEGIVQATMLAGLGTDDDFARTESGQTVPFLKDTLNSTVAETGGDGTETASFTYEPFGKTTVTGTPTSPFQFTGRERDDTDVGLYYYRARYYNPTWGRFTQEDPIGFSGGDMNVYAYVGNDPTGFTDPTGLDRGNCGNDANGGLIYSVSDSFAAFGDWVTFGGTQWVREKLGADECVDKDSLAYTAFTDATCGDGTLGDYVRKLSIFDEPGRPIIANLGSGAVWYAKKWLAKWGESALLNQWNFFSGGLAVTGVASYAGLMCKRY